MGACSIGQINCPFGSGTCKPILSKCLNIHGKPAVSLTTMSLIVDCGRLDETGVSEVV